MLKEDTVRDAAHKYSISDINTAVPYLLVLPFAPHLLIGVTSGIIIVDESEHSSPHARHPNVCFTAQCLHGAQLPQQLFPGLSVDGLASWPEKERLRRVRRCLWILRAGIHHGFASWHRALWISYVEQHPDKHGWSVS